MTTVLGLLFSLFVLAIPILLIYGAYRMLLRLIEALRGKSSTPKSKDKEEDTAKKLISPISICPACCGRIPDGKEKCPYCDTVIPQNALYKTKK